MNKFLKLTLTAGMAASVLAGCSSAGTADDAKADEGKSEPKEIIVGISPDYPPYESIEGDAIVGFDADMTEWLFNYMKEEEGLDYTYTFKQMSFDTIVSAIQTGQIDLGISGFTYDEDREKAVSFSDPYNTSAQVVVVAGDSALASVADLNGKKVGAQLGATGQSAAEEIEGAEVTPVQDVKVLMETLKSHGLDAVVLDTAVANNYAAGGEYKVVGDHLMEEENFIIAAKDNEELLKQVNTAIKAFKESDDYTKLKEKWGV